jgi:hypothetical protein
LLAGSFITGQVLVWLKVFPVREYAEFGAKTNKLQIDSLLVIAISNLETDTWLLSKKTNLWAL